jgi:hypothetical protein
MNDYQVAAWIIWLSMVTAYALCICIIARHNIRLHWPRYTLVMPAARRADSPRFYDTRGDFTAVVLSPMIRCIGHQTACREAAVAAVAADPQW